MKKILLSLICCLAFLPVNAQIDGISPSSIVSFLGTPAARGIDKEIWIAVRTPTGCGSDGMTGCAGTPEDPFDGGTQTKFDGILASYYTANTPNIHWHLGVGTFITNGAVANVRDYWVFTGAGVNQTTIQLMNGAANSSGNDVKIFRKQDAWLNYFEVTDMTLDCNSANQGIFTGSLNGFLNVINVKSKSAVIRNVAAKGLYAKSAEGFPLSVEHDGTSNATDYVEITNCTALGAVGNMTAIAAFDQSGGTIAGKIQGCTVTETDGLFTVIAYGSRGLKNFIFSKNRCSGAWGSVIDTGDFHNVVYEGNDFSGQYGVVYNGAGVYDDIRFLGNHMVSGIGTNGDCLQGNSTATTVQVIIGNKFETGAGTGATLYIPGGKGVLANNTVLESSTVSTISSGISVSGNQKPDGTILFNGLGVATATSLSAKNDFDSGGAVSTAQLFLQGATDTNRQLGLGYATVQDYSYLQSVHQTVGYTRLVLNLNGGGLALGTATDPGSGNMIVSGGYVGTTTNNNAAAGLIGEYVSATLATGSSITLTTNTAANVTSISLTAGDWDVTGAVDFTFGATTSYTNLIGSISTTSATIGAQDSLFDFETPAAVPTAGADCTFAVPTVRVSVAGTTTVYLVAKGTFTVSSLKSYGTIRARRIR